MNRATRRHPAPRRTYELALTGELADFHVTMGSMTGADLIAIRSGELAEAEVIRITGSRMVDHDFDVDDPMDLDYWILAEVLAAWGRAMEESANPPATGGR